MIQMSFYEEFEQVFNHYCTYLMMKIPLGDLNAKLGREDFFQPDSWE
jgi:hypothetical protein